LKKNTDVKKPLPEKRRRRNKKKKESKKDKSKQERGGFSSFIPFYGQYTLTVCMACNTPGV
jgi:hypothetical protein